ncbi:hypothetical protein PU630_06715 [Microbacterium horticulturae]|uniref:Acetone carboxylase n=1 Tax=Microbacterium horticulturae TaxID=3028316 RepID=A0ABY8C1B5_9MICO|nr:hypothetical protein [Microbacterium sp. KACC 23027]WEG10240.1 hypothetical protein PU630_06715 [Microbacterium sp. KACC 23027]
MTDAPTCSRAGCREPATQQVVWRNPRIHAADRRKIWLACDEHVAYLRDYLAARAFPVAVEPFTAPTPDTQESR